MKAFLNPTAANSLILQTVREFSSFGSQKITQLEMLLCISCRKLAFTNDGRSSYEMGSLFLRRASLGSAMPLFEVPSMAQPSNVIHRFSNGQPQS